MPGPGCSPGTDLQLASVLAVLLLSASSAGAVPVGSPSPLADFGPDTGVETFSPASHVAVFEFLDLFDDAPDGLSLFGFYYIGAPESGIPIFHFDDGTVSVAVVDFDLGTVTDFGETDDPAPPQVEFFAPQGGPIGFFFVFSECGGPFTPVFSQAAVTGGDFVGTHQSDIFPDEWLITAELGGTTLMIEAVVGVLEYIDGQSCFGVRAFKAPLPDSDTTGRKGKRGKGKKGKGKKAAKLEVTGVFDPALQVDFDLDDLRIVIDDGVTDVLVFDVPAGSLQIEGDGSRNKYKFHSSKGAVPELGAHFDFDKGSFRFHVKKGPSLTGLSGDNVDITLTLGANIGSAFDLELTEKKHHFEYKAQPRPVCIDN